METKGIYKILYDLDIKSESGKLMVKAECTKCGANHQLVYCNISNDILKKGCSSCANSNRIFQHKKSKEENQLSRKYYAMKKRCYNKDNIDYKNYGGRGIRMCDNWFNDRFSFIKWAQENEFQLDMEIDREDNNGDYTPDNCRWVTKTINNRNTRQVKLTEDIVREIRYGKYKHLSRIDISKIIGCSKSTIDMVFWKKTWKEI